MKKLSTYLLIIYALFGLAFDVKAFDSTKIYLFYGMGCPHCAEVLEYFDKEKLYDKYPIENKEIYFDRDNALLFNEELDKLGIAKDKRGVPTVIVGNKALVGDKPIIDNFVREADNLVFLQQKDLQKSDPGNTASVTPKISVKNNEYVKDEVGEIQDQKLDLTLPVVIAGALVDAINPCEFAVLIILMTTILMTGNSIKALHAGIAFSASIFISYFLMGLGLYKALSVDGISNLIFRLIGWLAIILGLANLKDYFWYGRGFLMEVPMSWRPRLKELIHSVTSPVGAFFVGFLVSLFLLPCTSGPYIVILGMLAKNGFDTQAIGYLILYNLIFVSPMIVISWIVYKGFNPSRAEEIRQKRLRLLHLIAGFVMLLMGAVILMGGFE